MNEIINSLNNYWLRFIQVMPRLAMGIFVIVVGVLIANWLSGLFLKRAVRKAHDPLIANFLSKVVRLVLVIVVVMIGLQAAGLSGIAGGMLATAGASAVILGFAFRNIAENFIAGIILAFNRPFHTDDTIQVGDVMGKVKSLQFRYIRIKTFDGKDVYLPNADALNKPLVNFTQDGVIRMSFQVPLAFGSDSDKAQKIVMKCIDDEKEVIKDDTHVSFAVADDYSVTALTINAYFWVKTEGFRREALETRSRIVSNVNRNLIDAGFKFGEGAAQK